MLTRVTEDSQRHEFFERRQTILPKVDSQSIPDETVLVSVSVYINFRKNKVLTFPIQNWPTLTGQPGLNYSKQ